jgi:hypothetical protein
MPDSFLLYYLVKDIVSTIKTAYPGELIADSICAHLAQETYPVVHRVIDVNAKKISDHANV